MKHEWKVGKFMRQTLPPKIATSKPEVGWKKRNTKPKQEPKPESEQNPYQKYFQQSRERGD